MMLHTAKTGSHGAGTARNDSRGRDFKKASRFILAATVAEEIWASPAREKVTLCVVRRPATSKERNVNNKEDKITNLTTPNNG